MDSAPALAVTGPTAGLEDLEVALAHHRAGRHQEAEALYRKVLDRSPDHPDALHFLGILETERGRPDRGAELIGLAVKALPNVPDPHVDLGNALRQAGKGEAAVASYRRALALNPDYPLAHICLASLLGELGRFEAAISHCRAAMATDPRSIAARIALAGILRGARRLPEAAQTWREIIELDPERAESYHQLAGQLIGLGSFKEALLCSNRALTLQPDKPEFHWIRGHALLHLYDGEQAEASFRRALALKPLYKDGWAGLSWALRMLGRFEEADAFLARLREIDPTDIRDVRHLPATGNQRRDAAEIDRLVVVLEDSDRKAEDRVTAGFALGRLLDESGRYDEAFQRYSMANQLVRANWPANGDRFDAKAFARSVDGLIASNTAQFLAEDPGDGNMSELPVFIVGMPRSGTTLVEQICASHPRVYGAGELDAIARISWELVRNRAKRNGQMAIGRRLADGHIVRLHRLGRGALRVVDKMPDNMLLVGLIARLFPRARIIYCSRDPRDTALSCFFQVFSQGAQPFSYDLADCGSRCRDISRLGAHWLGLRPWHMIEVNYEKLVADLEGQSRRLIEFLGLDWDPACLEFHRTERTVATVSHWQVRQPIYSSSIGRWRYYEKHLGPLFAALNDRADAPAQTEAGSGN
jgi:tetratricopeptide (TPR) repeat protein